MSALATQPRDAKLARVETAIAACKRRIKDKLDRGQPVDANLVVLQQLKAQAARIRSEAV